MEPITAILFMVYCTDDLLVCREPVNAVRTHASMDACILDKQTIERPDDGRRVLVRCASVAPTVDRPQAAVSWFRGPAGRLEINVVADAPQAS